MERARFRSIVYAGPTKFGEARPLQADYTFRLLWMWHDPMIRRSPLEYGTLTSPDLDQTINNVRNSMP